MKETSVSLYNLKRNGWATEAQIKHLVERGGYRDERGRPKWGQMFPISELIKLKILPENFEVE